VAKIVRAQIAELQAAASDYAQRGQREVPQCQKRSGVFRKLVTRVWA
jgi:hypothetical protein